MVDHGGIRKARNEKHGSCQAAANQRRKEKVKVKVNIKVKVEVQLLLLRLLLRPNPVVVPLRARRSRSRRGTNKNKTPEENIATDWKGANAKRTEPMPPLLPHWARCPDRRDDEYMEWKADQAYVEEELAKAATLKLRDFHGGRATILRGSMCDRCGDTFATLDCCIPMRKDGSKPNIAY